MGDPSLVALHLTFFGTVAVAFVMFLGLFVVFVATLVLAGVGRLIAAVLMAIAGALRLPPRLVRGTAGAAGQAGPAGPPGQETPDVIARLDRRRRPGRCPCRRKGRRGHRPRRQRLRPRPPEPGGSGPGPHGSVTARSVCHRSERQGCRPAGFREAPSAGRGVRAGHGVTSVRSRPDAAELRPAAGDDQTADEGQGPGPGALGRRNPAGGLAGPSGFGNAPDSCLPEPGSSPSQDLAGLDGDPVTA